MSKKYDLLSKSDMNKFFSDLKSDVINSAKDDILDAFECENCHKTFKAHLGKNTCPHCNTIINISFDI